MIDSTKSENQEVLTIVPLAKSISPVPVKIWRAGALIRVVWIVSWAELVMEPSRSNCKVTFEGTVSDVTVCGLDMTIVLSLAPTAVIAEFRDE